MMTMAEKMARASKAPRLRNAHPNPAMHASHPGMTNAPAPTVSTSAGPPGTCTGGRTTTAPPPDQSGGIKPPQRTA